MKHISAVISELFDRGDLPERLEATRQIGPHRKGDVLTWDEQLRAYRSPSAYVMHAHTARRFLGSSLILAQPIQQSLFAA
jgi:hypothetical protein